MRLRIRLRLCLLSGKIETQMKLLLRYQEQRALDSSVGWGELRMKTFHMMIVFLASSIDSFSNILSWMHVSSGHDDTGRTSKTRCRLSKFRLCYVYPFSSAGGYSHSYREYMKAK